MYLLLKESKFHCIKTGQPLLTHAGYIWPLCLLLGIYANIITVRDKRMIYFTGKMMLLWPVIPQHIIHSDSQFLTFKAPMNPVSLKVLCCCCCQVMSDSVWPHRRKPTRLPRPWDSPGKNTGVGCHFLLQCMKVKSESEAAQSCPTLSDPMDCSLPGSSVHGIFQARVLEWGAIAFSESCSRSLLSVLLIQLFGLYSASLLPLPSTQPKHKRRWWVNFIGLVSVIHQ